ncbi:MAG: hypothetical protein WC654_02905 [Patescibacteria group bacterium]
MENPFQPMEPTAQTAPESRSITIKLPSFPKVNFQSTVLLLLIVVGLIQTVQLFGIRNAAASASVTPASSTSSTTSPSSSGSSSSGESALPSMVGGC